MAEATTTDRPLCFVLMPFGKKPGASGSLLDFDRIYGRLIRPAVETAGLHPIRADEEMVGGIIHKPMFDRLVLCQYAVADLTIANANVYYELGIRHAVRPCSTALIFADGARLPFDLSPVRGMPYRLGTSGTPADPDGDGATLSALLQEARTRRVDSPIFQLLDGMRPPDISRLKTDVFRERIEYSERLKQQLEDARRQGSGAIEAIAGQLGPIEDVQSGVLVDLMLSYRAVKAWGKMIELVEGMPEPLAKTVMVREQYALALNRDGQGEKAEQVLLRLISDRGPSSETYGILGRVYKDRWQSAQNAGREALAQGLLDKAIEAYRMGFEADWRDAYPGINAVTLMEIRTPPDSRRNEILPVVTYSVKRRIEAGEPDYWDHATLLELAVLAGDQAQSRAALANALAAVRETWEPETTQRNLSLIRASRENRGEATAWIEEIETELARASSGLPRD